MPSEEIHRAVSCEGKPGTGHRFLLLNGVQQMSGCLFKKKKKQTKPKNPREKLCSISIPLFCVCGVDKAHLPQPMPQRVSEVGFL